MHDPAELCAELIRFDTSNYGEGKSNGEREAALWIAARLSAAGLDPVLLGPEETRQSVVVRVPGADRSLPALLVHAHLDVVPAEPEQWSVPPFQGLIRDGWIYGRGAADMKDMAAMTLATLLNWADSGQRPARDIVVAFVADEEDKGAYGADWLATEHPGLFAGVEAAIGESGGTATLLSGAGGRTVRLYPVGAGERGTMHIRVRAEGVSGHGSHPVPVNAVRNLVSALDRLGNHRWPQVLVPVVRAYIEQTTAALGFDADLGSEAGVDAAIDAMGEAGRVAGVTVRCSATPTVLRAGYKTNVIPGVAEADVDIRCLPGTEEETLATVKDLLGPDVSLSFLTRESPLQSPVDSPWFDAMRQALVRHDSEAVVVPMCMGGGTDAKAFSRLGIQCYGFAPLTADPDGRIPEGVHGVDERVPVASVRGGQKVLQDFLAHV